MKKLEITASKEGELRMRVPVKPLSANKMFLNRGHHGKCKTKDYNTYQKAIKEKLEFTPWPFKESQLLDFEIEVGLSSRLADLDNVLKPLLDTFQFVYDDFNDKWVYRITADKMIVPKGEEFVDVLIRPYEE